MTEKLRANFWREFPLEEFTQSEWEALCDGCGKCCLIKLENEKKTQVHYTKIACQLFDNKTCQCKNYKLRHMLVSDCIVLSKETLPKSHHWMPKTCAYRLIYEGKDLEAWHHLLTGSRETIHQLKISVKNSTIPEADVTEDEWADYIIYGI